MAEIINMPRLSDTMEEGTVAKWFKKVGDTVKEGDILAEIETDKATMEFEAFHEGQLLHIGIEEGGTAPVDTLLAIIGEKGEDISGLVNQNDTPASTSKPATTPEVATQAPSTAEMPEGVVVITMPRLSDTMEEGTVAQWLKKVGDTVEEGEILAEIETDKATMEFEAFHAGTLLHIGIQQGETAAVDSVLALIGPKGIDVQAALAAVPAANTQQAASPTSESVQTPQTVATPEPVKKEVATPKTTPVVSNNGRVVASPLAKKIAEEKGINLASVAGSGDHGRIIKRDVENFSASGTAAYAAPVGVEKITELANSQMRKTIAKRLAASKFSAPHYYLGGRI